MLVKSLGSKSLELLDGVKTGKFYEESNEIFWSSTEMIARFNPTMQEHIWHIKTDEKFFIIFLEVIKVFLNYTWLYSKCKTKKKSLLMWLFQNGRIYDFESKYIIRTRRRAKDILFWELPDRVLHSWHSTGFVVMPQNVIFFEEMNALMEEDLEQEKGQHGREMKKISNYANMVWLACKITNQTNHYFQSQSNSKNNLFFIQTQVVIG